MGRKAVIQVDQEVSELKRIRSKQTSMKNVKKLEALIAIKSEKVGTRQALADYMHVGKRTVERWLTTYNKEGLAGLLAIKARRKESKIITKQIHEGLALRINDPHNSFLGYWDAHRWIQTEYGIEVKYQRVREYLIKHFGTKVKRPRKSHVNKDLGAQALFKNAT